MGCPQIVEQGSDLVRRLPVRALPGICELRLDSGFTSAEEAAEDLDKLKASRGR